MESGPNYPPGGEQPGGVRSEPMTSQPRRETMEPTVTRADIYGVMAPGMAAWPRDITRWGPIFAGLFVAFSVVVLLGALGAAFGLQVGGDLTTTGAAIWGAIMLIVGFFVGGWIAGRASAVSGPAWGWLQGVVVWAITMSAFVFLGGFGLAGVIGATIGLGAGAPGALATPTGIQAAAWGTFIAMILGLIFAAIGGWVGGMMAETGQMTPPPPGGQMR
ncbi:MAG: hypothetical protein M1531_00805 [Chloroflexi bacterium]|nr:hypothetical protein [Chloroflexota bacterium]